MDKNPIGFMSYARSDDDHENGNLSAFRARLCGEVRMQSGDDSFELFQDHIHVKWGEQWQQRLDDALDSVKVLIPIWG
jgi:F-box protein 11